MSDSDSVRLDRWLWAARFYKTRSAAKHAIEGGKIHCAGQRAKPSKDVHVGLELAISRGDVEQIVIVTGLAQRRGTAAQAEPLYRETSESVARRVAEATQRRLIGASRSAPQTRPDRRGRRELMRLKQSGHEEEEY